MSNADQDEPELVVMTTVLNAMKTLDVDAQGRIIEWIVGKLQIGGQTGAQGGRQKSPESSGHFGRNSSDTISNVDGFAGFAELCSAASPSTDSQKVLVAGYWFQVCGNQDTFGSQECNDQLKHFGTPVGNVTRAFDNLKNSKPQLVMQVQKAGKTQQARKKFKLTHAGVQEVKRMLRDLGSSTD